MTQAGSVNKKFLITPSGVKVPLDENGMPILRGTNVNKTKKEYQQALLQADAILRSSPYRNYKPIYFDPSPKANPAHKLEFVSWKMLYLKKPQKGVIAPWTRKEKAYFESLKTKTERWQYLFIRSGLRSFVMDIPIEAIGRGKEYPELIEEVQHNKGFIHGVELIREEWDLTAAMLGNQRSLSGMSYDNTCFIARLFQMYYLRQQLGYVKWSDEPLDDVKLDAYDELKLAQIAQLEKVIKPDRFGMYPYIDELVPPEWVQEFAKPNDTFRDGLRAFGPDLWDMYAKGKLLDPAGKPEQSTKESREEVRKFIAQNLPKYIEQYDYGIIDNMTLSGEITETNPFGVAESQAPDWSPKRYTYVFIQALLTESKVLSVTPPQGYPNAPYYYFPEELDELYEAGKLDKKLNPTIPAIYRESFPQELRNKIEWYAKKHNIK